MQAPHSQWRVMVHTKKLGRPTREELVEQISKLHADLLVVSAGVVACRRPLPSLPLPLALNAHGHGRAHARAHNPLIPSHCSLIPSVARRLALWVARAPRRIPL